MRSSALSRMIVDAEYEGLEADMLDDMLQECTAREPHIDIEMSERSSSGGMALRDGWMSDRRLKAQKNFREKDNSKPKPKPIDDPRWRLRAPDRESYSSVPLSRKVLPYAFIAIGSPGIPALGPTSSQHARLVTYVKRMVLAWRRLVSGKNHRKKQRILGEFQILVHRLEPYGYKYD